MRVTRSARRHRIGNAHIHAALLSAVLVDSTGDQSLYVGMDDRGVELELILVPDDRYPGDFAVIHARPTAFRRKDEP